MNLIIGGAAVLLGSILVLVMCLPKAGKRHRLVETELEPYVAVAIVAGIALAFAMILSGVLDR